MPEPGNIYGVVTNQQPSRWPWRLSFAVVLGLLSWWLVASWLEPCPLWIIPCSKTQPRLEPLLEDPTGRWLIVSDETPPNLRDLSTDPAVHYAAERKTSIHLIALNAATGHQAGQLTISGLSAQAFPGTRVKLLNDKLWWFNQIETDTAIELELHCWPFTKATSSHLVHRWLMPLHEPVHVAFADGPSRRFVIQSTVPQELKHTALGMEPWTSMLAGIAQHALNLTLFDRFMVMRVTQNDLAVILQSFQVPFVATYALSDESKGTPKQLASWTLPADRWNLPVLGPDLRWLAWSDCPRSVSWSEVHHKPSGPLIHSGETGQPLSLLKQASQPSNPRHCYAFGDWLIMESPTLGDEKFSRIIDPITAKELPWPEELRKGAWSRRVVRPGTFAPQRLVVMEPWSGCIPSRLGEYQLYKLSEQGFHMECNTVLPEDVSAIGLMTTTYVGDQFILPSSDQYNEKSLRRRLNDWPRLLNFLESIVGSEESSVCILQAETGVLLKRLPHRLLSEFIEANKRLYVHRINPDADWQYDNAIALEAWSIPFALWSPWWGRSAGLAVMIVMLVILKRTSKRYRTSGQPNNCTQ